MLGVGAPKITEQFFGPGKRDRLDIKTERLANKQIQLSDKPAAKGLLKNKNIFDIECTFAIC